MRRTFRRHIRKTLAPNVPPVLQEANFAFEKGEYGHAAELYERIAQAADARGGPRAPFLQLQAGRARLYAGQTRLGIPSLQRGLELFAQRGQVGKLNRFGERVVNDLKERNLEREVSEMEDLLRRLAAPLSGMEHQDIPSNLRKLPTHCPACGAPLRPDEVEWLNETTAECAFCGSPVP